MAARKTAVATARAKRGPKGKVRPAPRAKRAPAKAPAARAKAALPPGKTAPRVSAPAVVPPPFAKVPKETMGRALRWAQVTARDLMRTNVITVAYDSPLSEVERVLSDNKISGAPVADEGGRIVGILSLKDLVDHYTEDPDTRPRRNRGYFHLSSEEMDEEDADAFEVPEESEDTAEDVMTSQIYTVGPDAGLTEIAAVMAKHKIHRVLVEQTGKFLGLLSTTEILEALSD
jgi:CBS domain-containing protein